MKNQLKALKVKIKSLAAEAQIIRREERRALGSGPGWKYRDEGLYLSLREHRVKDVRSEARAALLAYAFLRGKPYRASEPTAPPAAPSAVWDRVRQLADKFGNVPGRPRVTVAIGEIMDWLAVPSAKKAAA